MPQTPGPGIAIPLSQRLLSGPEPLLPPVHQGYSQELSIEPDPKQKQNREAPRVD